MEDQLTLQVKNVLAEIPAANAAASRWLADHHLPPTADYLANLAIEELITNCIKYGYEDSGEHIIQIELKLCADSLIFS
jgi:two-component sensor histidine kinase